MRSHFAERISEEQFAAFVEEAQALVEGQTAGDSSSITPVSRPMADGISPVEVTANSHVADPGPPTTDRRALVVYVEDKGHLIQQLLALRLSWLNTDSTDTDLVVMGPEEVLARLPDDLVKIPQQPAADDPVWDGYRRVNSLACFNGAGAEQLNRYSHILRTDVDTFITPAWNQFYPTTFTYGKGAYANDDVPQRIRAIAAEFGLTHRGMTNVGVTWYGPTEVVRRAAAFAEMLTKHLLTHHFATDAGQWPGWYRGVAMKYAGEIAVNHCAPDARRSALLDTPSTSGESTAHHAHIHCLHGSQLFSKHAFTRGDFTREDLDDRDVSIIKYYCLAMSLLSLEELAPVP